MQYAIVYTRVSTDRQDLTPQGRQLHKYLDFKELVTTDALFFDEENVSGRVPLFERKKGKIAYDLLCNGWRPADHPVCAAPIPIHHIVLTRVDRLGRNAAKLLELYEWFQTNGKLLHITDLFGEPITTQGITGKMFFGLQALFAEYELETIRERIQGKLDDKRDRNELIGTVPYGFDPVGPGGQPISNSQLSIRLSLPAGRKWPEGTRLIANPGEQYWIRRMAHWRSWGWSYNRIAKALNQAGVPTKCPPGLPVRRNGRTVGLTSGQWQSGNVAKVLQSKHTRRLLDRAEYAT